MIGERSEGLYTFSLFTGRVCDCCHFRIRFFTPTGNFSSVISAGVRLVTSSSVMMYCSVNAFVTIGMHSGSSLMSFAKRSSMLHRPKAGWRSSLSSKERKRERDHLCIYLLYVHTSLFIYLSGYFRERERIFLERERERERTGENKSEREKERRETRENERNEKRDRTWGCAAVYFGQRSPSCLRQVVSGCPKYLCDTWWRTTGMWYVELWVEC